MPKCLSELTSKPLSARSSWAFRSACRLDLLVPYFVAYFFISAPGVCCSGASLWNDTPPAGLSMILQVI